MISTLPISISQVVNRVLGSGKITRADERVFQLAILAAVPLSANECSQVTQVYDRLQMGLLKVVD